MRMRVREPPPAGEVDAAVGLAADACERHGEARAQETLCALLKRRAARDGREQGSGRGRHVAQAGARAFVFFAPRPLRSCDESCAFVSVYLLL